MTHFTRSGIGNTIAIATLWLVSFSVTAQKFPNYLVPGYQGKKITLEYSNYFFPAYVSPNANGKSGILKFNDRHSFSLDYVISRHFSLGASYSFLKSKYQYPYWGISWYKAVATDALGDLSATTYGLHWRQFYSFLAPVGSYYRVDINYITYQTGYDSANVAKLQRDPNNVLPNIQNASSYHGLSVGVSYGYQRVYYNRIVFDYGFQLALNTLSLSLYELDDYVLKFDEYNYLKYLGKNRLTHHYFCNLYVGIGILL